MCYKVEKNDTKIFLNPEENQPGENSHKYLGMEQKVKKPSASQNLITVKMALNNVHGMAGRCTIFQGYSISDKNAFSYQRYPMANLFINDFHLIWCDIHFQLASC